MLLTWNRHQKHLQYRLDGLSWEDSMLGEKLREVFSQRSGTSSFGRSSAWDLLLYWALKYP